MPEGFTKLFYPTNLRFRYTNHAGITEDRSIGNVRIEFGRSSFHPEILYDWFLIGTDEARAEEVRCFPLSELLPPPQDMGMMLAGKPRSSKWSGVRKKHLEIEPTCAACGTDKMLNVHHVVPFHIDPDKELDQDNLITLCEVPSHGCHFSHGHLHSWSAYNPTVREDAAAFLARIKNRKYG